MPTRRPRDLPFALPVKILGAAKHLPERVVTNAELEDRMEIPRGYIETHTGIRERRFAAPGTTTSGMAAIAARAALERAELGVDDVDVIVFAGAGAEQAIPCTAVFVQDALGARARGIPSYDVNATCFSFVVAMHQLGCQIALGQIRRALVVTAELPSRGLLDFRDPKSASLFGDGAAAMVLGRAHDDETGFIKFFMETYSEGRDFARIRGGGTKHLPSDPDYTRDMQLFEMNGKAIFKTVLSLGADGYEGFFDDNIAKEDYDVAIPHQVNAHGVSLYAKKGGFTEAQVFSNLATVGNMVSASLPVGFCDALERGRIRRGSRVCLLGTAAGITIGGLSLVY